MIKQVWIPLLGMACVPFSSQYVDALFAEFK
jgi:hypothetical protein